MTSKLTIDLEQNKFQPTEVLKGQASWLLQEPNANLELRLFWYTKGRGTQDVEIIDQVTFENSRVSGNRDFEFVLPLGPYSFSGKLISLIWAVELVVPKTDLATRSEFVLAPEKKEIDIYDHSFAAQ